MRYIGLCDALMLIYAMLIYAYLCYARVLMKKKKERGRKLNMESDLTQMDSLDYNPQHEEDDEYLK